MNRWIRISLAASALLAGLAFAQGIRREAPKDVVLGQLVVTAPPQVTIDGKPDRLSPGSRIRDLNNMLVLSGGIVGKNLPVVYRRDAAGLVHEVWILTDDEVPASSAESPAMPKVTSVLPSCWPSSSARAARASMSAAQDRFKQAKAPSEGRASASAANGATQCPRKSSSRPSAAR